MPRRGTTLTEVLMAILVMSVGVLAVMSLFPIAFLRSAQGTQLTNATLLKMRAEALVDMFGLVTDQFIPQPIEGNVTRCLIDPLGWQDLFASAGPAQANQYGFSGNVNDPPEYRPSNSPVALANVPRQPTRFINVAGRGIDFWPMPLRRLGFAVQPTPILVQGGTVFYSIGLTIPIFPAGDRYAALRAVALPDTFETQFTATPDISALTQVEFTHDTVEPGELTALSNINVPMRLTLIDSSGKRSTLRQVAAIVPDTGSGTGRIGWAQPLPASFVNNLSEVRVETEDPRYTWMLTVRKKGISGGSVTEIDCVVFFNRAAEDPEEELVHAAAIPSGAPGIPPEDAAYAGTVSFTRYPSDPQRVPPLKKGGYVFDPTHAEWYRVQDILSEDSNGAVIRLDRRPEQFITTLVVPRGVIHVFPMQPRIDEGRRL